MKRYSLFLSILSLTISCSIVWKDAEVPPSFTEKYRPQFHFTPPSQWMNDPNGMFYYKGEYHLFYQYYPDSNVWGPMHWGHAVSKNMIEWEHLPIAIYPDELGYIFSGSAVVDRQNTSGLGSKENPPIIAIFTYHNPKGWESGAIDFQYQGIAYSLDRGRNWTKYEGNPVLPNPGIADFRDPKVIWYEPTQKWIMTLAVWDHVSFYSSDNLIDWKYESDFGLEWGSHAGVWECPDLFPMSSEERDEEMWVLLLSINPGGPQGGSATQYFIGNFDGSTFVLDKGFKDELGSFPAYNPEGIVFDDFESGYGEWVVEGEAFGEAPANGAIGDQNAVIGMRGSGFANSYHGGDISTGSMTSPEFTIEKPYLNFKVGGGNDTNLTYVSLLVEGEEVNKAVGGNSDKLKLQSWNVTKYLGKQAQLKIVDEHSATWGHILVDEIKFSDAAARPEIEKAIWLDYGADNYAGVTWSDIPEEDGRRLFMGWMSNWEYAQVVPTYQWRSAMTLPRSLTLNEQGASYRLHSRPVEELNPYIGDASTNFSNMVDSTYVIEASIGNEFTLTLSNELNERVVIGYENVTVLHNDVMIPSLFVDRTNSGKTAFSSTFGRKHQAPLNGVVPKTIRLFVDVSSIEVFINEGELVMTELVFPTIPYTNVEVDGGIEGVEVSPIRSIWR